MIGQNIHIDQHPFSSELLVGTNYILLYSLSITLNVLSYVLKDALYNETTFEALSTLLNQESVRKAGDAVPIPRHMKQCMLANTKPDPRTHVYDGCP